MNRNTGSKLNASNSLVPPRKDPKMQQALVPNGSRALLPVREFDQPVILQRSPIWSRAIVWSIIGMTAFGVIWANLARVEEAIPATGKLEPQGTVKEIKVPLNGVVKEIHVKDGQRVKQGQLMLLLDPRTAQAQLGSQQKIRSALEQENQFYRSVIQGAVDGDTVRTLNLPNGLATLIKSRSAFVTENQLYRAQLSSHSNPYLSAEERLRLETAHAETASRTAAFRLEVLDLEKQLGQNQTKLESAKDVLAVNQKIYDDLTTIAKEGGIARMQYLKQQQEVRSRQAEVDGLVQEQERLNVQIMEAQEKLKHTISTSAQEVLNKIADNQKRIAEIDTQLNREILDNDKKIAEITSQLRQTQVTLQYEELRAPVDGTVFDLKVTNPGFVANSAEPVLKVVPDNTLIAQVNITNKDIGFVREGLPADIRIDSFPFSEFGDIKGKLVFIGSDAKPPDQLHPYYTFPAKVQLDRQSLHVGDRDLPLQSGMSVSANIKLRDRTVMSIFTDEFTRRVESLKFVR